MKQNGSPWGYAEQRLLLLSHIPPRPQRPGRHRQLARRQQPGGFGLRCTALWAPGLDLAQEDGLRRWQTMSQTDGITPRQDPSRDGRDAACPQAER